MTAEPDDTKLDDIRRDDTRPGEGRSEAATPADSDTGSTTSSAKARRAARQAAKAEEAAEAARLAEEAAARAREAARLAQIAAEAAAAEAEDGPGEDDDSDERPTGPEAVKSPQRTSLLKEASQVASSANGATEAESGAAKGDSLPAEGDEPGEQAEAAEPEPAEPGGETSETVEDGTGDESGGPDGPARPAKAATESAQVSADADAGDTREAENGADGAGRRSRARRGPVVIGILVALVIALGAGTTVLALKVREQNATETASRDGVFAASRAVQALSSYDYRSLDADLRAASALTTGTLREQFDKLAEQLKALAPRQQAVSTTTVMKAGAVSATPEKVVALVYANRSSATSADKDRRLPEPLRIRITMVPRHGRWLASELVVIS
ncbi:hypothetical protein [Actinomadura roseirufa]|uniref:hypothetical protein n=1 Tax=Actinomadura roseirufa TaxID=2094049 RepID=UPI001040E552|nr:hypothetical protein [Actinomadura roseirufa]